MRLVWDRSLEVTQWVAEQIPQLGAGSDLGPAVGIGIVAEDGRLVGGAVFNNWMPRFASIEVSFALENPRWFSRSLLTQIMRYPFDQVKVGRVTAATAKKNKAMRTLMEAFGWKREGVIRRGFGSEDAVIYGLLRREWARSRFNLDRVQGKTDLPTQVVS